MQYSAFWAQQTSLDVSKLQRASLIAVHIRWGDKLVEANLKPVEAYLDAVTHLAAKKGLSAPVIFLSSEDGTAIDLFSQAVAWHNQQLAKGHRRGQRLEIISYSYERPRMACGGIDPAAQLGLHGSGVKAAPAEREYGERFKAVTANSTLCPSILEHAQSRGLHLGLLAMTNLYLALEAGGGIVCSRASNWCRLLHELADADATRVNV